MKTIEVEGKKVHVVTYKLNGWPKMQAFACKRGNRVFVGSDTDVATDPISGLTDGWAFFGVGARTFARLLDAAINGDKKAAPAASEYGTALAFEKADRRNVQFTAPCGEVGEMTMREAELLRDALVAA